jgi:hypothetical protein
MLDLCFGAASAHVAGANVEHSRPDNFFSRPFGTHLQSVRSRIQQKTSSVFVLLHLVPY